MGHIEKGQRFITNSDVVNRSEGNWGPRNINHGRVKFTFEEFDPNDPNILTGKTDNGAYFRWPANDATMIPAEK